MQPLMLPLFPLGVVLFPDASLPLHIFEDRYKEMIGEALRKKEEFGVVLAGQKGIANMGCTASIEEVIQKYPDGRMDILTVGRRRFEIDSLNEEKDYLQAEASIFDDLDSDIAPLEIRMKAIELIRSIAPEEKFDIDAPLLSFSLAPKIEDVELKQVLLSMRSEKDRLEHMVQHLPNYLNRHQLVDRIRYIAPRNGHSKHFKGEH